MTRVEKKICFVLPLQLNKWSGAGQRIIKLIAYFRQNNFIVDIITDYNNTHLLSDTQFNRQINQIFIMSRPNLFRRVFDKLFYLNCCYYLSRLHCLKWSASEIDLCRKGFLRAQFINNTRNHFQHHQYSVVLGEYLFSSPCLKGLNRETIKVIDTIDVFSNEQTRVAKYGVKTWFACGQEQEAAYLSVADVIFAIQSDEKRLLKKMLPNKTIILVGFEHQAVSDSSDPLSGVILFVGTNNFRNQSGLNDFICHAWPRVLKYNPSAKLRIVGTIGQMAKGQDWPNVEICGEVANTREQYGRAAVVINPVRAGTGLKVKNVEALCYGKAVVAIQQSVAGLPGSGNLPLIQTDDWECFANEICNLINNKSKRKALEARAFNYASRYFTKSTVYADLAGYLRSKGLL